jgi:hypothetical protein
MKQLLAYSQSSLLVKAALLSSLVALVVLGGWFMNSSANQKDKFTLAEATTRENNGARLVAKPGFKLRIKNRSTGEVVAYKANADTKISSDTVECWCKSYARCTQGGPKPCCSHSDSVRSKESCSVNVPIGGGSADCKGICDKCEWR